MKFDVVVGNPPYNNDIYIPFVEMGHSLASTCSVFITPAKWQAKGGEKNEEFRQNIVPHMSKIVYYPYCVDVFDIWETSGVCYYLIDKSKQADECIIKNICKPQPLFNSTRSRKLNKDFTLINMCDDIIQKLDLQNLYINNKYCDSEARWQIWINNQASGGLLFSLDKKSLNILEPIQGVDIENENTKYKLTSVSKLMFSSNIEDEALSFVSWINSKFVRFLVMARASVMTGILNDYCWRFVPDPGAFDHIFTDEELYKKYNLTPEEINIIESVIKERK